MEYQIIAEDDLSLIIELVNHYLKNGWKLQGGVATASEYVGKIRYSQALVKDD
jgi:hypothetical protein